MQSKICLITGAGGGIGKATAIGLAEKGASITIVCRDDTSGRAAVADIRAASGNSDVDYLTADLSSQSAIHLLVSKFISTHERLDVLINNAGLLRPRRELTVDGLEMQFAVNHLAYFLLTNLLLDTLKAAPAARILSVTSRLHKRGTIDFDDLQAQDGYRGLRAYANSKLANVLFTYELARRLNGAGITANCLHPGLVATGIFRATFPAPLRWLAGHIFLSPQQGAATSIYLASSPKVEGISGKYFAKQREYQSAPASHDASIAARLWDVSLDLTGLAPSH